MNKSLEERFLNYLETQSGFESIDKLNLTRTQINSPKADFFGDSRKFIIEIKSLKTDTKRKVETILERHRSRPEFPVFYGEWDLEKILNHLPDGKDIRKQINEAVTTSIKGLFGKAHKQITKTKEVFKLNAAKGILVILNDTVDVLSPELLAWKIRSLYKEETTSKGTSQVPNLDAVLMISETHFTQLNPNLKGFPCLIQPNPCGNYDLLKDFISSLIRNWSAYMQAHYARNDLNEFDDLKKWKLESVEEIAEQNKKPISNHELYRRYYKNVRYLKDYDEKYLKWFLKLILTEHISGLLATANKIQKSRVKFWNEIFVHFVEELRIRGLDFKVFSEEIEKLDFGEEGDKKLLEFLDS